MAREHYTLCDRCGTPVGGPMIDRLIGVLPNLGSPERREIEEGRVVLERNRERAHSRQTFYLCGPCNCLFDDWLLQRGDYERPAPSSDTEKLDDLG